MTTPTESPGDPKPDTGTTQTEAEAGTSTALVTRTPWGYAATFVVGAILPALFIAGFFVGISWQKNATPAPQASAKIEIGPQPQPTGAPQPQPTGAPQPQPTGAPQPQPTGAPQPQPTQPSPTEPKPAGNEGDIAVPTGVAGPAEPYVYGDPSAPTTITIVEDITCPFCAQFEQNFGPRLREAADQGKIVLKQYVVDFFGPGATSDANAVACAANQGAFNKFVDLVYKNQTPEHAGVSTSKLEQLAVEAGVPDIAAFKTCLEEETFVPYVKSITGAAQTAAIPGTPAAFVNGVFVQPQDFNEAFLLKAIEGTN